MLSDADRRTVRSTLTGVELEKLPAIRQIHVDSLRPHYARGHKYTRAVLMREYAIELIDQILAPDGEEDEDPADVWSAFARGPHGITAPPQRLDGAQ